eukprot:TRINITY_DN7911_c2_g1_i1.p1 TRINITY_DN7911_c2_g1~~TRINITY_DN7911_c2_g1_i1.p1  ORF type:complete len:497 (-),score=143.90 TRINITY_DN7911_c2_g1_i1:53-1330(-)
MVSGFFANLANCQRLVSAASRGDVEGSLKALADGADLTSRNGSGRTPLQVAILNSRVDVVIALLRVCSRAIVAMKTMENETALDLAKDAGSHECRILLRRKLGQKAPEAPLLLVRAIEGDEVAVQKLLDKMTQKKNPSLNPLSMSVPKVSSPASAAVCAGEGLLEASLMQMVGLDSSKDRGVAAPNDSEGQSSSPSERPAGSPPTTPATTATTTTPATAKAASATRKSAAQVVLGGAAKAKTSSPAVKAASKAAITAAGAKTAAMPKLGRSSATSSAAQLVLQGNKGGRNQGAPLAGKAKSSSESLISINSKNSAAKDQELQTSKQEETSVKKDQEDKTKKDDQDDKEAKQVAEEDVEEDVKDVDEEDDQGNTALMMAVGLKRMAVIEVLVAAKADPSKENKESDTALAMATREKNTKIIELLQK